MSVICVPVIVYNINRGGANYPHINNQGCIANLATQLLPYLSSWDMGATVISSVPS